MLSNYQTNVRKSRCDLPNPQVSANLILKESFRHQASSSVERGNQRTGDGERRKKREEKMGGGEKRGELLWKNFKNSSPC